MRAWAVRRQRCRLEVCNCCHTPCCTSTDAGEHAAPEPGPHLGLLAISLASTLRRASSSSASTAARSYLRWRAPGDGAQARVTPRASRGWLNCGTSRRSNPKRDGRLALEHVIPVCRQDAPRASRAPVRLQQERGRYGPVVADHELRPAIRQLVQPVALRGPRRR